MARLESKVYNSQEALGLVGICRNPFFRRNGPVFWTFPFGTLRMVVRSWMVGELN